MPRLYIAQQGTSCATYLLKLTRSPAKSNICDVTDSKQIGSKQCRQPTWSHGVFIFVSSDAKTMKIDQEMQDFPLHQKSLTFNDLERQFTALTSVLCVFDEKAENSSMQFCHIV